MRLLFWTKKEEQNMDYCNMALKIPASPIRDMMVRAAAMEDVISFTVGEPDFNPKHY